MSRVLVAVGALLAAYLAVKYADPFKTTTCRCQPGELCWPSIEEWNVFNASIDGNLVEVRPLGYVCHDPTYDKDACDSVKSHANNATWRIEQPGAVQLYNWEKSWGSNESCYLDEDRSKPCHQGRVPIYSVTAESIEQLQTAVKFVKKRNLRVIIRNTGHDHSGRSSGPNSIQINTARLKGLHFVDEFIPFGALESNGSAVTIGAGVLAGELYSTAAEEGYTVVAGECSTVGVAGGFIQGGGISILSPLRGLASDSALQFEVITADGSLVVANQYQNQDLFWALRGGGGGTFGIVTSVTIRTYPEMPLVISKLDFKTSVEDPIFWEALAEQAAAQPALKGYTNSGEISIFRPPGEEILSSMTWNTWNTSDTAHVDKQFTSLRESLNKIGIKHTYDSKSVPRSGSFFSTPTMLDIGGDGRLLGSALISHAFLTSSMGPAKMVETLSKMDINPGDAIVVRSIAGGQVIANKDVGAVNPEWRSSELLIDLFRHLPPMASLEEMESIQDKLTNFHMPLLRSIEPGRMGTYLNMADPQEKDFQHAFWGENYEELYRVKKKWDKNGLFIVRQGVGSEDWDEECMCRIK